MLRNPDPSMLFPEYPDPDVAYLNIVTYDSNEPVTNAMITGVLDIESIVEGTKRTETLTFKDYSDENGLCPLEVLKLIGMFEGHIAAEGYVPLKLTISREQIRPVYTVELQRAVPIGGIVLHEDTLEPIPNTTVTVSVFGKISETESYDIPSSMAQTDKEGKWVLEGFPSSVDCPYNITVQHDDYVSKENVYGKWNKPYDQLVARTAAIYMYDSLNLHGKVMDRERKPIKDARVCFGKYSPYVTVTDEAGDFLLKNLKREKEFLMIEAKDYQPEYMLINTRDTSDVEFCLKPALNKTFQVVDTLGENIEGAEIRLEGTNVFGMPIEINLKLTVKTDSEGIAVLEAIPSNCLYHISKAGYCTIDRYTARFDDSIELITLQKEVSLSGKVYDSETGELVSLHKQITGNTNSFQGDLIWKINSEKENTNGEYRLIMDNNRINYAVQVSAEGYKSYQTPAFRNEGEDVTYDIYLEKPDPNDFGTVYTPDGQVASKITVGVYKRPGRMVVHLDGCNIQYSGNILTQTDSDGTFQCEDTEEDYFIAAAGGAGFKVVTKKEYIDNNRILYLDHWGRIEGTVNGDKSAVRVSIKYLSTENKLTMFCMFPPRQYETDKGVSAIVGGASSDSVDDDGVFVRQYAPPGNAQITKLMANGNNVSVYGPDISIPVTPGETTYVEFPKVALTVKGFISLLEDEMAIVTVNGSNAENTAQPIAQTVILNDGLFEMENIMPGNYILTTKILRDQEVIRNEQKEISIPEASLENGFYDLGEIAPEVVPMRWTETPLG